MNRNKNFFDFLLYVGVEDERIKAAINRAGYQTLMLLIVLLGLDVWSQAIFLKEGTKNQLDIVVVLTISAVFFVIQSYRYGCTFLETKTQKRLMQKFLVSSSLLIVAMGYVLVATKTGRLIEILQPQPVLLWTFPLISGVLVYGFLWGLVSVYEKATAKKLERELKTEESL